MGVLIYVLVVLSTFLHEKAHQLKFSKYRIKTIIVLNLLGGKCKPVNKNEDFKSESLSPKAKREIIMAGTKADLIFITFSLIVLVTLSIIFYYLSKAKINNLHLLLLFEIVIFSVLIIKVAGLYKNLFHEGRGRIKGDLTELTHQITKNKK